MIYVLQHSYKKEYNNFNDEIQGRREYLYNIFKMYFIVKYTNYSKNSFLHPNYYMLESFPANILDNYYFIVGDTNFVIRYIKNNIEKFNNKILIIITCKKNNNGFFEHYLPSIKCSSIFIAKLNNDEADYYDGKKWGLNFKITLSELDLYNSNKKDLADKLKESFERIK